MLGGKVSGVIASFKEAVSQGMKEDSKIWKRQENSLFPIASRRNAVLLTPCFIPARPVLDF